MRLSRSFVATASLPSLILVSLLATPLPADPELAQPAMLEGWGRVFDPDGDCAIVPDGGAVSMKVPGTAHDFAAELKRWNAPRILSEQSGDFVAEVRISGVFMPGDRSKIPGRRPYHGAGLLLVKDRNTSISLHRGCANLDGKLRHYANFELRKDGELAVSRFEIGFPDQDIFLRLERRGNRILNATSLDGVHWYSYNAIELELPQVLQLGIVGINSSDIPLSVRCQDYAVFRRAVIK